MNQFELAYIEPNNRWQHKVIALLSESIISFIVMISLVGIIYDTIHPGVPLHIILIISGVVLFPLSAIFEFFPFKKTTIILLAVLLIGTILSFRFLFAGFNITVNRILEVIGRRFAEIFPFFNIGDKASNHLVSETIFWCFVIIIFSLFCIYLVRSNNKLLSGAIVICVTSFLAIINPNVSVIWIIFFFMSMAIIFCRNQIPSINKFEKNKIALFECFLIALISIIVMFIFLVNSSSFSFEKQWFAGIEKNLLNTSEQLRYEKDERRLTNGVFNNIGTLKYSNNPQLEIIMSKPDSLYLRGFIGGHYTGRAFERIDNSKLYDSADLFYWLHENDFYGQKQLSNVAEILNPNNFNEEDLNKIAINNLGSSSKVVYTPYELHSIEDKIWNSKKIGDEALYSEGIKGSRFYRYNALPNQVKAFNVLAVELYESTKNTNPDVAKYLDYESHYNKFVYDTYTQLPDETKQMMISHLGDYDIEKGAWHYSYGMAKQEILDYLTDSSNVMYSEKKIDKLSENEDFIQTFMEKNRVGYDVHFAAAATMMFRYYGIPARYVEGFIITPEDVDGVIANEPIKINDDEHAHAWTEIYHDGIGWVPFEITPPYIGVMETPDDIQGKNYSNLTQMLENQPDEKEEAEPLSNEIVNSLDMKGNMFIENLWIIGLIIIIIAFMSLMAFFITKITKRKLALKKRKKSFESENYSLAIESIFKYSFELLHELGFSQKNESLYKQSKEISNVLEEDELIFLNALYVHQEARFSDHEMNKIHVEKVGLFKQKVLEKLIEKSSTMERIKMKYLQCIY